MGFKSIEIERSRFYDKTYSLAPENKNRYYASQVFTLTDSEFSDHMVKYITNRSI